MRPTTCAALCAAATIVMAGCGDAGGSDSSEANPDAPQVVTALYPLTYLVERIGGDAIAVTDLTPPGAEPHDLELTARQVGSVTDADLVVYIGDGFQPALEDVVAGEAAAFDVLEGRDTLTDEHGDEDEHGDDDHGEEDEHGDESGTDPHVWLDPLLFAEIAADVANRLAEIAPDDADTFRSNAADLTDDLEALDRDLTDGLASCERREIIVSHEAFGYLTEAYDLEQIGVAGTDPESEPSGARLAELERIARELGVTTIFFEELASPDVAETLAGELGIEVDVLTPLENAPAEGDYLEAMRANLDALRGALACD